MDIHPYLEPGTLPSSRMWYVLATSGEHPTIRVGHACIHVPGDGHSNGCLYITGGANPSGTFSDTFCLDLDSFTWQKYSAPGFAGRYEHTIFWCASDANKFYVFGGADCGGNRNDVQEYDITTRIWTTVETTGSIPPPRTFHNGTCIGNKLIVYGGGERGAEPVSDKNTYSFDITEQHWSVLKLRGDSPKPRHGHLMVAIGNRLFLHGGMSGSLFFNDLHVLDLDCSSWSCVNVRSVKPTRRAAHGGSVSGTDVFLFGGMNSTGALNDFFMLNTITMQWSTVDVCGSAPERRLDFATCTLRLHQRSTVASANTTSVSQSQDTAAVCQTTPDECSEGGKHLEIGSDASKQSGDGNIIDVTSEFFASQDIINLATCVDGSSDAESCSGFETIPDAASAQQVDAVEVQGLNDAVANIQVQDVLPAAAVASATTASGLPTDVEVALVLGGMDTGGEIFDDCLVFRLRAQTM